MREWLSGRASPCQGESRGFDPRLPLQVCLSMVGGKLGYRVPLDRPGRTERGFPGHIYRHSGQVHMHAPTQHRSRSVAGY
jgi:hypothetical protein